MAEVKPVIVPAETGGPDDNNEIFLTALEPWVMAFIRKTGVDVPFFRLEIVVRARKPVAVDVAGLKFARRPK